MSNSDKMQQVNIELRHEISGDPKPQALKSYLVLDSEVLPDVKEWKIGEQYEVKLIVRQVSVSQEEKSSVLQHTRNNVIAKFEVIKATEAEEE